MTACGAEARARAGRPAACPPGCPPGAHAGAAAGAALPEGLSPDGATTSPRGMAAAARALRGRSGRALCALPVGGPAVAEALAGGGARIGADLSARPGPPACPSPAGLAALPAADLSRGRAGAALGACRDLRASGEHVRFELDGALSAADWLMGGEAALKALAAAPRQTGEFLDRLRADLRRYAGMALDAGAEVLGYADPACRADLLGPRLTRRLTEAFTVPLLADLAALARGRASVAVCPWTVRAVEGCGGALVPVRLPRPMAFDEACLWAAGRAPVVGGACLSEPGAAVSSIGELLLPARGEEAPHA